jgi:REP element-mobilizing transposase RayT
VYHVLNRANGRLRLFKKEGDFLAFERVLLLAHRRVPIRILDWCVMSNHWHLVLWPKRDGELTAFMRWLTLTHAQRWKHSHAAVGHGHLYQGRFKSFPIEQDEHLLTVLRYVERNPVRAGLVRRAELSAGAQNRPLMGALKPAILRNWRFVHYRCLSALAGSGRCDGKSTQDGRSSSNSGTCARRLVQPAHCPASGRSPGDGWTPSSPVTPRQFKTGQRAHRLERLFLQHKGRAHRLCQRARRVCQCRRSLA